MLVPVESIEEREIVWRGRGGPLTLLLGGRVFAPTHTSREVAEGISVRPGDTVIDVGSGSGDSLRRRPVGRGQGVGHGGGRGSLAFAKRNAERLGLADRVEFRQGSLFEPLDGVRANVVIGDVSGIPDEIAQESDWFPGGFSGGPTGAEVPVAMQGLSANHMLPGGRLYLPERVRSRTRTRFCGRPGGSSGRAA